MAFRSALIEISHTLKSVLIIQRQLLSRYTLRTDRNLISTNGFAQRSLCSTAVTSGCKSQLETGPTPKDQVLGADEDSPLRRISFNPEELETILQNQTSDMPLEEMVNPYQRPKRICILCKYNVDLDWKNVQLLSQFTSPYTGRIYGRHITGLCIPMQKHMARLIKRARFAGFMPFIMKETAYLADPKLFDPFKPGSKKQYH